MSVLIIKIAYNADTSADEKLYVNDYLWYVHTDNCIFTRSLDQTSESFDGMPLGTAPDRELQHKTCPYLIIEDI